jgi:glucose-1-phosphate cytidylyltransferase
LKVVILAGGLGTRFSEETRLIPKPMIQIGGKPILWHIMKIYSSYGFNDFLICLGYKGQLIKEYFLNYSIYNSDLRFDLSNNSFEVIEGRAEDWKITLVDTGENTMTGGRLKRVEPYLKDEKAFCMTYGDGLADVDIKELVKFHLSHGKKATLTATYLPGRFGALDISNNVIKRFQEKPIGDEGKINGGFFVLSPKIFELIEGDETVWEQDPLTSLATSQELMAFEHKGFFQPMDTLRDKTVLNDFWESDMAPWKIWD